MSDTAAAPHHGHDHVKTYLRVFIALLVLTLLEYAYARIFAHAGLFTLIAGLTSLAVIKAALVGMFFMHLAFEGRWKYLILIPTAFFAVVVVAGIYPDVGVAREKPAPSTAVSGTPGDPMQGVPAAVEGGAPGA